uniref:Clp protease adapter protein ClpF, chloroplastic isoform X2 n=1 Tax=Cicer arietinum TaxID=3827 RepID=A0A1S2XJ63_CICAR|nr:clp protease adapter protein ClpF, chloroplastic isoform X2 [Cicer arietinum]
MVQGVSLTTLATCGKSRIYGLSPSWMAPFQPFKRSNLTSANCKHSVWNQCIQNLVLIGYPFVSRQNGFKTKAAWMFRGGEQGLDASVEQSESSNEDILMFFFHLDLATRVQCALNMEEYDIAQQLRNKLTEVEEEVIKQQQSKRGLSSKSEAQDKGLSIIRLRSDLQSAIEKEDYALAAELRDKISKLEAESLAASAKALAHENAQYVFRLGQKVTHKIFGYRAIICGMDPVCGESSSWMENAQVKKLSRGSTQPFYQLLVDVRAEPNLLVAYVAEENLFIPEKPDKVGSPLHLFSVLWNGFSWRFHPY